jgi:lactose/cellobiose-specific phosphotransferase system IIC component
VVDLIERIASVFAKSRLVRTVSNGLINLIPFVLVGAVCLAALNLPINAYQNWLAELFNGRGDELFEVLNFALFEVMGLAALLSVSHSYAGEETVIRTGEINRFLPMFTAFICYIFIFVLSSSAEIQLDNLGRHGLFFALAIALSSSWLFFSFDKIWMRIRPLRPSVLDTNLHMRSAFRAVFPTALTLLVFALLRVVGPLIFPLEAIGAAYNDFLTNQLMKDTAGSIILTVLAIQLLWFFGGHGTFTILDQFPLVSSLADPSLTSFATQDFYFNFAFLGGAGATIGLLIALFIAGSRHRGRLLAKASLFPSLFNVNEILLYGIPVVLNPFFFIPFVLSPLLAAALAYFSFSMGLVPPLIYATNWTTPVILSGYLSTGSIAGSVLQIVCIAGSVLLYIPFVTATRNYESHRRKDRLVCLQDAATKAADDESMIVLTRLDEVGETAREVSSTILKYFERDALPFYLVYQPKTDKNGRVMGAEALLRWVDPELGYISPIVLVELCDESGLTSELGRWITQEAIEEYDRWKRDGIIGVHLSINLNARQLKEDRGFAAFVGEALAKNEVDAGDIELEITEHIAMHANDDTKEKVQALRDFGIPLSIDDMGIGYSSLTYISDFGVSLVKLDISLVSHIDTDETQQEIVRSLVQLAQQLNLTVIVEGVETREQVDALVDLGVSFFQGYYFSKPLEPADFIDFVRKNGVVPSGL